MLICRHSDPKVCRHHHSSLQTQVWCLGNGRNYFLFFFIGSHYSPILLLKLKDPFFLFLFSLSFFSFSVLCFNKCLELLILVLICIIENVTPKTAWRISKCPWIWWEWDDFRSYLVRNWNQENHFYREYLNWQIPVRKVLMLFIFC